MPATETNSQLYVWEIRANKDTYEDIAAFADAMKGIAKKWVVQLEKGASGYEHWQGRISLPKKKRLSELKNLFRGAEKPLPNWIEPTVNKEHKKEAFYCLKEDTRIDGPWDDVKYAKESRYIPRHVRGMKLRPWQQDVAEICKEYNDRVINLLYCAKGGIGKSMVIDYLDCHNIAESVPPLNDAKDIMQLVCCVVEDRGGSAHAPKAFTFDLPRAMKKDKLYGLYTAIEQIKDGRAYDLRYTYRRPRFDRPQIWVFTNTKPDMDHLSADRWRIWEVVDDKLTLIPHSA